MAQSPGPRERHQERVLALVDGGERPEVDPEGPVAPVGLLEPGLVRLADELAPAAAVLVGEEEEQLPVARALGAVAAGPPALAVPS